MVNFKTRRKIENADPFVCLMPRRGMFDGTEGEEHIKYAISLEKHIIVWRLPGRDRLPVPAALDGYDDYIVIDGDEHALQAAIIQYWELGPDDEVIITNQGYAQ